MTQNQFNELVAYIENQDKATQDLGKQLLKETIKKYHKIVNVETDYLKTNLKRFQDSDIYYLLFVLANTNSIPLVQEYYDTNNSDLKFFNIGQVVLAVHNTNAKFE